MCLILFAYRVHLRAPLVVAANRDEFYARPAAHAHYWPDAPHIYAGRDTQAGGTWLGVNRQGRFAAVTNFAESAAVEAPASRGALTADFLNTSDSAWDYANAIDGRRFAGFSLLLFDGQDMVYLSNRNSGPKYLQPGLYGLANTHLDTGWPKVRRGKQALATALDQAEPPDPDRLLQLLADDTQPPDAELPQRGRDLEVERRVAPCFIRGEQYGTRASTAVIFLDDAIIVREQSYGPHGQVGDHAQARVPLDTRSLS